MRKLRIAAVAATVLTATVAQAVPAGAESAFFKLSANKAAAGTKITVTSSQPCDPPPTGKTFGGAIVGLVDNLGYIYAAQDLTSTANRSFSGSFTVPTTARNGGYGVTVACVTTDDTPYDGDADTFTVISGAGKADPAVRFAGTDRITTAIAASQDLFHDGSKTDTVVVSRSDSFADALAGSPLATISGAPLLLTGSAGLDGRTEAEIKRVLTAGGTVYLLGGTGALSPAVANSLALDGYEVVRLAGANRYATAVAVANEIDGPTTLLLADGGDFKAGLIAGAAAWQADEGDGGGAVLLTSGATMPAETKAYIDGHGAAKRYAIGTQAAKADAGATAITGSDDSDLSQKVAAQFFPQAAQVAVASSSNFPDALSGGAHAGAYGAPLLLTPTGSLPASVQGYLSTNKASIAIAYVYGGTAAVSDAVRSAVSAAISG